MQGEIEKVVVSGEGVKCKPVYLGQCSVLLDNDNLQMSKLNYFIQFVTFCSPFQRTL